jgi:hypothetical protein
MKFLIEWGMHGYVQFADVVEAETLQQAIRMADEQAEDLWESNKIATARPFRDKQEDGQPTDNALPGNDAVLSVRIVGCGSGNGGSVTP